MDPSDHLYYLSLMNVMENQSLYFPHNMETYWSSYNWSRYDVLVSSQESEYYGDFEYIQQRNKEELLHKDWMRQRVDLEKKFQEKMEGGMKVRSDDNYVKFTYKYKGHEIFDSTIFRFKIILVYRSLLRKWYLSPGYSFVPKVINLKDKLKSGTYHPFSEEVFDVINDVRRLIDVHMTRLTTVYQFVHNAQEKYKDVQIYMNAILTKIKLTFMESAWPSDLRKLNVIDRIVLKLKLDKSLRVYNIAYQYIHQRRGTESVKEAEENENKLKSKLRIFFSFPLEEAFERFIAGEKRVTNFLQERGSSEEFLSI